MTRSLQSRRRTPPGTLLVLALACGLTVAHGARTATRADGGVLEGVTTLLNSGDTASKLDLVFLGDGFTSDQQDEFNARVDQAAAAFLAAYPIKALQSAFNIHRVNVSSPESGTDKFSTCGVDSGGNPKPTGDPDVSVRTAMDTRYCGGMGTVYRCVGSADPALVFGFAANAPDDDFVVVLINDGGNGGCRIGGQAFLTLSSRFTDVVVHELGHLIFQLGDEYGGSDHVEDTYTGGEPTDRVNLTIETNRASLKWRDLVLAGTNIPTQRQPDCSDPALPEPNVDRDIVGTFEGAHTFRCGAFRPQYDCRMRVSSLDFCSVCRRAIIRHLLPNLGSDRAVFFRDLLVRDDHDGWPRGAGDIYLNYDLRADGQHVSGRWPASGDSGIDGGDTKTLNVFAGLLSDPGPAASATVELRVRDGDWPDGDDTLSSDSTSTLPVAGAFEVDRSDYRLRGDVRPADLRVLLDVLNVKDDSENWVGGAGDIFVEFTVSNGSETVSGRWPSSGTRNMGDHDTAFMKVLAASLPAPAEGNALSVRVRVMDDDGWFTGGDDEIGEDTFEFSSADDFGATATTHVRDQNNYRVTLSVAKRPPPQIP